MLAETSSQKRPGADISMKASNNKLKNLVPHPKYGAAVIASGYGFDPNEVRDGFWMYRSRIVFPESAIPADIDKQNFAIFPRKYYVDMLKQCRECQRSFLFFAQEQKYWFETLGFFVDADCVLCPECRASNQELKRRIKRYSERITESVLSEREMETLLKDAAFLVQAGYFKNLNKVSALKNRAWKLVPASEALSGLVSALDVALQSNHSLEAQQF